jgi:putative ABC transport system ATP-binding protein
LALVELNQVHKRYQFGDASIHALKGIDLAIDRGEFVAIWGPSGSGKSTLCHLIGIIDEPDRGQVRFCGRDTATLSDDDKAKLRNQRIGFVFQNFNLLPVLSGLENVMFPLQLYGVSTGEARRRSAETLEQLDLQSFMHHRPAQLSGGQRQRIAIARALVNDPDLIIADEPTANLDSENARRTISLMREINQSVGAAFVFSTHDQRLLERVDRRLQLEDGAIVADDRVPAILESS